MCLEKPDDEENACAVLSDLTPGTKYSCSDTRLGYSGFQVRVGDLDFEVPICTPICDAPNSEANDPIVSAIDGTCIETPNDGMSCQTLQFE